MSSELDTSKFSTSRIIGILSIIGAAITAVLDLGDVIPSKYTAIMLIVATVINSVTERIQGGKSSLKLGLASGDVLKKDIVEEVKEGKL